MKSCMDQNNTKDLFLQSTRVLQSLAVREVRPSLVSDRMIAEQFVLVFAHEFSFSGA
eukprot:SAG31_NODE_1694_length_7509_cov_14.080432_3_plen_57_part_00